MKTETARVLGFASYDFSNTGYVLAFQAYVFPLAFVSTHGASGGGYSVWGWMVGVSTILAIVASPFVGALGDLRGRGLVFKVLVIAAGLLAAATSLLFESSLVLTVVMFVIFNAAFELSLPIYDSFLVNLAPERRESTRLSTFARGFGYLGGVLFALTYLGAEQLALSHRYALLLFALLFILLSIPSIKTFSDLQVLERGPGQKPGSGYKLTRPSMAVPWRHLLIYWLVANCSAAILYFMALFASLEIGLSTTTVGMLMILTMLLAFPLTLVMGYVANTVVGQVATIRICLLVWAGVLLGLYLANSLPHMLLVMVLVAFVMGSTDAILRSHYAMNVKKGLEGAAFGYFAMAQKSATIFSPLLVASVASVKGELRPAFAVLGCLTVLALGLTTHLPRGQERVI